MNAPKISYFLRPGVHPRTIQVHLVIDEGAISAALEELGETAPHPNANAEVVFQSFLQGIQVGCLGPVGRGLSLVYSKLHQRSRGPGQEQIAWSLELPALSVGAFAVLGNMLIASAILGSGVVDVRIEEESANAEMSPEVASLPAVSAPFRTLFPEPYACKELGMLITFRRALNEREISDVQRVLAAWENIVWGGFPVPSFGGLSMVQVTEVMPHGNDEITGKLYMFTGSKEAWDALARAAIQIHRDVAHLEALEVV